MADVTIDAAFGTATARAFRSIVFTSADVGYAFFIDGDADFFYIKTTDGGATWSGPVEIDTDTAITCIAFDIWYDKWTPGDTGTKIHIAWLTSDNDDVVYRSLDTNGDTLGTQVNAFVGATAVAGIGVHVSITKAVGGNLYICSQLDAGAELVFTRSLNGGGVWLARTSPYFASPTGDWCCLLPAANTGDTQDCLAIYDDVSANTTLMLWYDDSANTWTSSAAIATVTENTTDLTGQYPFSCSIRHSDGKLLLSVVTERDTATADHRVFELDRSSSAFSITEKTAITTNIDDHYYPSVFIDQNTDDIYVAYNGKRDGSEALDTAPNLGGTKLYYTKSTDGGATWTAGDTTYSEDNASFAYAQTWAPLMGERFYVAWRQTTIFQGNKDKSVAFAANPVLSAEAGSFAVSGTAASLEYGRELAAAAGSYVLTGAAASLEYGREIAAGSGSFVLSGQAASLEKGSLIASLSGSYAVTGTAAGLSKGRTLAAGSGEYLLSGAAASLEFGRELAAGSAAFVVTGQAVSLAKGRTLIVASGTIAVTGQTVSFSRDYVLHAEASAFIVTGQSATLQAGLPQQPQTESVGGGLRPAVHGRLRTRVLRPYDELFVETGGAPIARRGKAYEPPTQQAVARIHVEIEEFGGALARAGAWRSMAAPRHFEVIEGGRGKGRRGLPNRAAMQWFLDNVA